MLRKIQFVAVLLSTASLLAFEVDLRNTNLYNETAYISSQCYTKTIDENNENILHNPCFSCHTKNIIPNYTFSDQDLQEAYDFPQAALKNPWTNLFKDRRASIKEISDEQILKYIREDNYKNKNNSIILKNKLSKLSKDWDVNNNKIWDGYIPDCEFNFDEEGFDKKKEVYTGWRAFAYYPFLGTFWPTNGSTDDVMIRLDKIFQKDKNKNFNLEVYKLNLSIVESLIKQKDILINEVDERIYQVDLNQNNKLDFAKKIVFKWIKPKVNKKTLKVIKYSMSYVGLAKEELSKNNIHIAPGLYPTNTEFLHSVRYLDIKKDETVTMSKRMKELRYAKKTSWFTYSALRAIGDEELKEKNDFPDRVDKYIGSIETGLFNKRGWLYQGFIEDVRGELRPQSYEETLSCMGCHSNLGVLADSTFVFQRKFENNTYKEGWYHWSKKGLKNIKDRVLKTGETEYIRYLKQNNAGDEFRENQEVKNKFFVKNWENKTALIKKDLLKKLEDPSIILNQNWKLKTDAVEKLKNDISYLLLPSKKRALKLNKAYKIIVNEQSYIYGKDAIIKPSSNVHKEVKQGLSTNLEKI